MFPVSSSIQWSHTRSQLYLSCIYFVEMLVTVSASGRPGPHLSKMSVEFKSSRVLEVNLTLTWWLVSFLVRLCCCNQSAVSIPSSPWFCLCCLLFMSRWGVGSLPAHLDICCTESAVWCLKHFIRLIVKVNTVTTSGAGVSSVSDFKLCCFVSPLTAS